MAFQDMFQCIYASAFQLYGVGGFGVAIGLFLASNARFGSRKGFMLSDLIGVVIVLVGGFVLALYPMGTDLFAGYGIGLFLGVLFYIVYNILFTLFGKILHNKGSGRSEKDPQSVMHPSEMAALETTVKADTVNINLPAFRQILTESFNKTELETLCFDLKLDFESLSGDNKDKKVIELINYVKRRGQLVHLLKSAQRERPNSPWFTIFS